MRINILLNIAFFGDNSQNIKLFSLAGENKFKHLQRGCLYS